MSVSRARHPPPVGGRWQPPQQLPCQLARVRPSGMGGKPDRLPDEPQFVVGREEFEIPEQLHDPCGRQLRLQVAEVEEQVTEPAVAAGGVEVPG